MEYFEVINLEKYQHYSDRENIWIKWYQKSLDDYKFCQLTDAEKWYFVGIIMLAVKCKNNLPLDYPYLYSKVAKRTPKGSYRVAIGVKKMLDLGLFRLKNASIEVVRKKEKSITKENSSFKTTDKIKHTEVEWLKILSDWKKSGNKIMGDKKLVIKKDSSRYLVDINGTWEVYNSLTYKIK